MASNIKGYQIKDGKVVKRPAYGLSASAKIAKKKKAKTPRVVSRKHLGK